ncbi:RHS repeat-associated core domain-containing protein [Pseudomonas sp. BW13M1]|uniref:RHS repeat-associated core domain-containing protein n=1 Tax=Pseudomonas peradeniyensis TaxID=2745488 RepID=A0A923K3I7_9PSED|nr:RHS repeat-associated core domain-containing protein [Pseudomonas peradeniyensis]MBV4504682.1 RHS repeat-associated core domain-containing protein [Pseudomonas peradeniyensis]
MSKQESHKAVLYMQDAAGCVMGAGKQSPIAYQCHGFVSYGGGALPSLLFAGQYFELFGAGYLLGNGYRLYRPDLLRFTSPDGMSPFDRGGINSYAYCAGDPVNRLDVSGRMFSSSGRRAKVSVDPVSMGEGAVNLDASGRSAPASGSSNLDNVMPVFQRFNEHRRTPEANARNRQANALANFFDDLQYTNSPREIDERELYWLSGQRAKNEEGVTGYFESLFAIAAAARARLAGNYTAGQVEMNKAYDLYPGLEIKVAEFEKIFHSIRKDQS